MENNVICPLPFMKIYNNMDAAAYTPCCWSNHWEDTEHNIANTLPVSHFTGEVFNRIRKEMLSGKRTDFLKEYCNTCWMREEEFGYSPRIEFNNFIEPDVYKNFDSAGNLINNDERFIQVGINVYGNHCNLECYECLPDNSSSRCSVMDKINDPILNQEFYYEPHLRKRPKISKEHFKNIVKEIVQYADKIRSIDVVGGEPMLMKDHFYLLDNLIESGKSKNIEINYTSNMTLMTLQKMKKYFDNFCNIRIQWSIDALKERNYWLRYPTNWEQTVKNCNEVRDYLIKNGKGSIQGTITPSLFNITSLKETYDWLLINDYAVIDQMPMNVIDNPKFLSPQHLPQKLKEKIASQILKISKSHYNQMMFDRNEESFQLAIKYADKLDEMRGTNWRVTFPEIAEYDY
jgi:organic radical activating enzyme